MNVALFGGTFDPIHRGHVALARAAQEHFALARVDFIPANIPPHKQRQPTTAFVHRYAMVVLATMNEKRFVPSLLEAPAEFAASSTDPGASINSTPSYTINTVRRVKQSLDKKDRLFFVIGIDAFLDIAKWREPEALLCECEFVVASRPGFSLNDVTRALPKSMQASVTVIRERLPKRRARGSVIHLLDGVYQNISSTAIRDAAAQGRALTRWLDPAVARYIQKLHLYKPGARSKAGREARPRNE